MIVRYCLSMRTETEFRNYFIDIETAITPQIGWEITIYGFTRHVMRVRYNVTPLNKQDPAFVVFLDNIDFINGLYSQEEQDETLGVLRMWTLGLVAPRRP